ncbi:MAG: copper chaperone PCu(A)C [Hyphomicrobiales bacterium]|nr:copper chaperone PCu(A)C [Hyphomicrobiales bacterium]
MDRKFIVLMSCAYIATLLAPVFAFAHSYTKGNLEVFHPWTFEKTKPGATVIVRMQITNSGKQPDTLIAAESMEAASAELRLSTSASKAAKITIPAGKTVLLSDKGPHIVLTRMRSSLTASLSFPMVLLFEKAGPMRVDVAIEDR